MADKIFYEQEENCPICQKKFTVRKVRRSMCVVSRRDSDFCVIYQSTNPNLYSVWVCPHCGYAAPDATFAEVTPSEAERLAKGLAEQGYLGIDFSGERDVAKGITAFEQAVRCLEMRGGKNSAFASLYLRMAWLYRSLGDPKEFEYIAKALDRYEKAYNSEPMPLGKMSEVTVTYLIGELYRRTGNAAKAVLWFSQVVSNPKARMEPQILQLARDGWQTSREETKKSQKAATEGPEAAPGDGTAPSGTGPGATPAAGDGGQEASPKPTIKFVESKPAAPPPNVQALPGVPQNGAKPRPKVVSVITLFADQVEWLKKVSLATKIGKKRLDSQAIVRAILDSVTDVEPKLLKCETEEQMAGMFRTIRKTGAPPAAAGKVGTTRTAG